jgi:hypothetical protein
VDEVVLKCIWRSGNEIEVEFMRSVLEADGIEATIQGMGARAAYPVNVGDLGAGGIWVRAEDADRAAELIDVVRSGQFALDEGNEADEPELREGSTEDP